MNGDFVLKPVKYAQLAVKLKKAMILPAELMTAALLYMMKLQRRQHFILREVGIILNCMADGACLDFMDAVDIYTIFGNALDNAIESVSKLEDPEQRMISVMVFSRADLIFL